MHIINKHKKSYEIDKRRRQIRLMLSHGVTEQELADKLGIDQSTVSRDIKAINQMYQDQAEKHDMDYYYGQCSDKIQEAERLVWENYENLTDNEKKKYCCQTAKTKNNAILVSTTRVVFSSDNINAVSTTAILRLS